MLFCIGQNEILHDEFNVADTAAALLQVKMLCVTIVQLRAHALAHFHNVLTQAIKMNPGGQGVGTNALELLRYDIATCDRPGAK